MPTVKYIVEFTGTIEEGGGYWRNTPLEEFASKVNLSLYRFAYRKGDGTDEWIPMRGLIKLKQVIVEP